MGMQKMREKLYRWQNVCYRIRIGKPSVSRAMRRNAVYRRALLDYGHATTSFLRKQESSPVNKNWTPVFTGVTN
jgi:hypothetical protein